MFTLVKRAEDLMSISSRSLITLVVFIIWYPPKWNKKRFRLHIVMFSANEVSWWKLFRSENMRRSPHSLNIFGNFVLWEIWYLKGLISRQKKVEWPILIWRLATDTCCWYVQLYDFPVEALESRSEIRFMLELLKFMLVVSSPPFRMSWQNHQIT